MEEKNTNSPTFLLLDEAKHKLSRSLVIGKDIEFIGEPSPLKDGFVYKFKAISPRAMKYFKKLGLIETDGTT